MKKVLFTLAIICSATISFAQNQTKKIDTQKSSIFWKGSKVIGSSHTGTITLNSGEFIFSKNVLKGGTFVANMNSINVTDLSGEGKTKLENHLKADDFFGTDKFPTATLNIKKATKNNDGSYQIQAEMIIKNIKQDVNFVLSIDETSALAQFNIDRTKHNIKYGSGSFFDNLGDKAIDNEFNIKVELFY